MPMQKWIRPTLIVNALFFLTLTSNAWAKVEEKPTLKTSYQSWWCIKKYAKKKQVEF